MQKLPGLLVTFEGTEGAGKSTLIQGLRLKLESVGFSVVLTREPGGSPVAEQIRELILRQKMDPWAELFLYEASRAEHLAKTILPALEAGKIVLCDRYADSSLAYQSAARGLPWEVVHRLNQIATQGRSPDLTFWLDLDPEVGLRRAQDQNRFEAEGVAFQSRVRAGFRRASRAWPRRWMRLDAGKKDSPALTELAFAEILRRFKTRLHKKLPKKLSKKPARTLEKQLHG